MLRTLTVAAIAALTVSTLAVTTPTAAADIACRGTLTGSYSDTVTVPAGATCVLSGARVAGDVKVGANATVTITGATVEGNVQAESSRSVTVTGSNVRGDVQAKYLTTSFTVAGSTVEGNVQVEESRAALSIRDTRVGGDVQVFKNPAGAKSILRNRIDGNLQCKENRPAPTGNGNQVRGDAEDQCRGLVGGGGGNVDIYLTPGTHHVNGRVWRTACEKYSTTVRCRTDIQATTVTYRAGRYVQTNGWVFNNLTYAPMARSAWGNNPLANTGTWRSDGRTWRTECDTAVTGRNGCRSYVTASVIEYRAGAYRTVTKEVLNNMVRFA